MKNLRQHMIEDMKLRALAPGTQARYLEARPFSAGQDGCTFVNSRCYGMAPGALRLELTALRLWAICGMST